MARCEDYPCCGHGPVSGGGDGGGCPDSKGRFVCCGCGGRLPKNSRSALCARCLRQRAHADDMGGEGYGNGARYGEDES